MYPLQSMLRIRGMREDTAQSAFVAARAETRVAERELSERQEKTRRYEKTREARRDRVYAAVMGRVVTREDLDSAREAVTRIDEEGVLLKEDEQKAQTTLDEKRTAEELKHQVYFAATKARIKIEEHRDLWVEAERKEEERKADTEMEEFTGKKEPIA